ncbi:MAG: hypothetical protein K2W85_12425 [Phycisphaerales bacterium]|nr:hypothetical protein [Phycisphaerales bacterium]
MTHRMPEPPAAASLDHLSPAPVAINLLATALVRLISVESLRSASTGEHPDSPPESLEPAEHGAVSVPAGERASGKQESLGVLRRDTETRQ